LTEAKPNSERRKYTRAKFHEPVELHPVVESKSGNVFEVQEDHISAEAKDLGEGGIRLNISNTDSPVKIFKLTFQLTKTRMVDVYSKLAWSEEGFCGLQFIVVDEEVRRAIRNYVEKSR
jgi:c-di-GMP-binding flagellar brake protein YcgR